MIIWAWIIVVSIAALLYILYSTENEFCEGVSFVEGLHRLGVSEPIIRLAIRRDPDASQQFLAGAEHAFKSLRATR